MVPLAGSAYTYAYATWGIHRLDHWLGFNSRIRGGKRGRGISWSNYFQSLLAQMHMPWPDWLGTDLRSAIQAAQKWRKRKSPVWIYPL